MKVKVDEGGHLYVDGVQKKVEDMTQDFLEKLVDDSLEDKVEYDIAGDKPLAQFFGKLRDGTKEGSELRILKEEAENKEETEIQSGKEFVAEVTDTPTSQIMS